MHWALQRTSQIIRLVIIQKRLKTHYWLIAIRNPPPIFIGVRWLLNPPTGVDATLGSGRELKCSFLQIYALPVAALDSCTNIFRGLPCLRLQVGINSLLHAGGTGSPVCPLEAAMKAIVVQRSVTMAIARLLVQHCGNLRRHLICNDLIRMREVDSSQLVATQQRREGLGWSTRVVGGNLFRRVRPLGRCRHRDQAQSHTSQYLLHARYHTILPAPEDYSDSITVGISVWETPSPEKKRRHKR
jgi:hypothetical protein